MQVGFSIEDRMRLQEEVKAASDMAVKRRHGTARIAVEVLTDKALERALAWRRGDPQRGGGGRHCAKIDHGARRHASPALRLAKAVSSCPMAAASPAAISPR